MAEHHPLLKLLAKDELTVVGLMTGTSMDGLDVAVCRVRTSKPVRVDLLAAHTVAMPSALKRRLKPVPDISLAEAARLDMHLGQWFADATAGIVDPVAEPIDLVGSHGQTVFHEHGMTTSQIGEPCYLAQRLRCPVVSDFRRADMAAGGCGAPLVPIFDRDILQQSNEAIAALNIGGIANVTLLPARNRKQAAIAFDCGPGNMVLDGLAERYSRGSVLIDRDGAFAAQGTVDAGLLAELMSHPFFKEPPPRSAGREQFGHNYVDELLARVSPETDQAWYDLFATASALTIQTIVQSLEERQADHPVDRLLVSGGGVHNAHLMRCLADELSPRAVNSSAQFGVDPDFKEAMAFAYLAALCVGARAGNVPSVTGATSAVCLGRITLP